MAMMLVDAYKKGIIKVGDYINYNPDYKEHVLPKTRTGWNEDQILKTEELKYQFAGITYGKMILVASGVTKNKIFLKGMEGHFCCDYFLNKSMQECYSSKKYKAKGMCLTKPIFESLPEEIKKKMIEFYLASPYTNHEDYFYTYHGVYYAFLGRAFGCCLYCPLGGDSYSEFGVCPAVDLPFDIKIDENKNLLPYED